MFRKDPDRLLAHPLNDTIRQSNVREQIEAYKNCREQSHHTEIFRRQETSKNDTARHAQRERNSIVETYIQTVPLAACFSSSRCWTSLACSVSTSSLSAPIAITFEHSRLENTEIWFPDTHGSAVDVFQLYRFGNQMLVSFFQS